MFKYLVVLEDGEVVGLKNEPTTDDLLGADDGILTIIRVSDQTTYYNGEWSAITQSEADKWNSKQL